MYLLGTTERENMGQWVRSGIVVEFVQGRLAAVYYNLVLFDGTPLAGWRVAPEKTDQVAAWKQLLFAILPHRTLLRSNILLV